MAMNKSIVVNSKKCLACKSCEIACALVHSQSQILEEAVWDSPKPQRMITVETAGDYGVPIQCMHCEEAPCITVCPTAAINRHEINSPVLIDKEKCIGCKYCLVACPFGVIDISRDGKVVAKCDLCIERTRIGEDPVCVSSCPTGALKFCELNDHIKQKRTTIAKAMATASEFEKPIEEQKNGIRKD
jgi:carbon-monoxide dehydrogenase iron sulfur subunit